LNRFIFEVTDRYLSTLCVQEKGVFVDAKEEIVTTPGQIFTLLQKGESKNLYRCLDL
jgi:hypothetical protein